jgi:hypothetical protein
VRLFGSQQEYDALLAKLGVRLDNPAIFVPSRNLLASGSDLNRLAAELDSADAECRRLRSDLARLRKTLPERFEAERTRLLSSGVPPVQAERTLEEFRSKLRGEIAALARQADAAERKNSAVFDEATRRLFRTLRHEALHAWLTGRVFPPEDHHVPAWLNEGLAQVLESGVLENGALRIDAPDAESLALLKSDLRKKPLRLAELLRAEEKTFLVAHNGGGTDARRHYAYAWGLAHYLAFERRLLHEPALADYVRRGDARDDEGAALRRFEELVGEPLEEFEARWRDHMLRLRP